MFERCLYFNSNALARKINALMEARYAQFDLTPPQAYLLRLLFAKGGANQQEIGSELKIEKSTVTRLIKKMEDSGWIARDGDHADCRKKIVYPTEKALCIAEELEATGNNMYTHFKGLIGEQQMKSFVAEIRSVCEQI